MTAGLGWSGRAPVRSLAGRGGQLGCPTLGRTGATAGPAACRMPAECGNQFWLGVHRAGQTVRFWVDCEWVHLSVAGVRVKSLRSRFTTNDVARLRAQGAVPAGPAPVTSRPGPGSRAGRTVVEVERTVARSGTICLGSHVLVAAEILAGRRVGIYIEPGCPLLIFDPDTRELLRTRPNPLSHDEAVRLQRARPVGPVPRPRPNRSGCRGGPRTPA